MNKAGVLRQDLYVALAELNYVDQDGVKLEICLPLPPKCWDERYTRQAYGAQIHM
ncbi:hypothetical protein APTSU1_000920400 [Apodemus speciosus]|uniref:Uncharacterized protein n=1 Tax=Apodemus speciosus TaxID=105296 RepID=A0ABQ0F4D1_APOSI